MTKRKAKETATHSRCICGLPARSCMLAMLLKMVEGRRDSIEKKHVGFLYWSWRESDTRAQKDEANIARRGEWEHILHREAGGRPSEVLCAVPLKESQHIASAADLINLSFCRAGPRDLTGPRTSRNIRRQSQKLWVDLDTRYFCPGWRRGPGLSFLVLNMSKIGGRWRHPTGWVPSPRNLKVWVLGYFHALVSDL